MTHYEDLLISKEEDILTITLNRPKVLNSLRSLTLTELSSILSENADDEDVRALIITGQGESAFCAGGDIKEMELMGKKEARAFAELSHDVLNKIENMERPVISAVNGLALGAGCDLATACDICVASEKAKFGMPSAKLGIITPFGGTQRLPRIVGPKFAKYMLLTGETVDAKKALELGLATKIATFDSVLFEARAIAKTIIDNAPIAIGSIKRLTNFALQNKSLEEGDKLEVILYSECFASDDRKEGMRAFLDKRKPLFKGR